MPVKIPADLACSGEEHWTRAKIDSCVAPLVRALQEGGIDMRGSCCGHGKTLGEIHLQDGRLLLILDVAEAGDYLAAGTDDARLEVLARGLYKWVTRTLEALGQPVVQ